MNVSFASIDTGDFLDCSMSLPEDQIEANTPAGYRAVEGLFSHLTQRMDWTLGGVVAKTPPRPADTPDATWTLNANGDGWIEIETDAARRKRQLAEINAARNAEQQRLTVEFNGHVFQADPASRAAVAEAIAAYRELQEPPPPWRTADNQTIAMSPDEFRAFFSAMRNASQAIFQRGVAAKDALE